MRRIFIMLSARAVFVFCMERMGCSRGGLVERFACDVFLHCFGHGLVEGVADGQHRRSRARGLARVQNIILYSGCQIAHPKDSYDIYINKTCVAQW